MLPAHVFIRPKRGRWPLSVASIQIWKHPFDEPNPAPVKLATLVTLCDYLVSTATRDKRVFTKISPPFCTKSWKTNHRPETRRVVNEVVVPESKALEKNPVTVRVMLRDICSKPPSFAPGLTFFGLALQGGDQMGLSYTDGSRFSIQYPFPPIIMDMKIKRGVISKSSYLSNTSPGFHWTMIVGETVMVAWLNIFVSHRSWRCYFHLLGWPILKTKKNTTSTRKEWNVLYSDPPLNIFPLPIIIPIQKITSIMLPKQKKMAIRYLIPLASLFFAQGLKL